MKKAEILLQFIQSHIVYDTFWDMLRNDVVPGITAEEIERALGIVRNNASTLLNKLVRDGFLVKIRTRPVRFVPHKILAQFACECNLPLASSYTLADLQDASRHKEEDPFLHLIGNDGSLKHQVGQAKAAIVYPPKGLHTLLLGESGVGKTTFAATMHAFGAHVRQKQAQDYPFVSFNCADYYTNPQLLISQLFGHAKNAFTGANTEKAGLVEKANGGILFLDEVHRLPPEGQEMLFYLMDHGIFARLGESGKPRKTEVLIVCATTEDPENNLLATFMRRIPVIIQLPNLAQKSISERVELLEYFFRIEAVNLKQPLLIAPETMKALAVYPFDKGNVGQLRSEIKLLCANAFLQSIQDGQPLHVDFASLTSDIKDRLFHLAHLDKETKRYLSMFTETIIISPNQTSALPLFDPPTNLYNNLQDKLLTLRSQGLRADIIHDTLQKDIEAYFRSLTKSIRGSDADFRTLYKVIPAEIVDTSVSLIDFARHHLNVQFHEKFIFGFCFHVQALLSRSNQMPELPIPPIAEIKQKYSREFQIAEEMIKRLRQRFHVEIRDYECGFLAVLLANNKAESKAQERIAIMICCHGETTASSMAQVANTLLDTTWMKAINMPLSVSVDETYQKFRSMALSLHQGQGVLLLVDMGSLTEFGRRLQRECGIEARVIPNISMPLTLELLRKVLYKTNDLDAIYQTAIRLESLPSEKRRPAILALCMTGKGAAPMVQKLLLGLLGEDRQGKIDILVEHYIEIKRRYETLSKRYHFLAVIGNMDPQLDIPYYSIRTLLDEQFQRTFLQRIDSSIDFIPAPCKERSLPPPTAEAQARALLDRYVTYVNPRVALKYIQEFAQSLQVKFADTEKEVNFYVHLGCMLDRCLHQDAIYFDDIRHFIQCHQTLFDSARAAGDILASHFDTSINDDEICYILQILIQEDTLLSHPDAP